MNRLCYYDKYFSPYLILRLLPFWTKRTVLPIQYLHVHFPMIRAMALKWTSVSVEWTSMRRWRRRRSASGWKVLRTGVEAWRWMRGGRGKEWRKREGKERRQEWRMERMKEGRMEGWKGGRKEEMKDWSKEGKNEDKNHGRKKGKIEFRKKGRKGGR